MHGSTTLSLSCVQLAAIGHALHANQTLVLSSLCTHRRVVSATISSAERDGVAVLPVVSWVRRWECVGREGTTGEKLCVLLHSHPTNIQPVVAGEQRALCLVLVVRHTLPRRTPLCCTLSFMVVQLLGTDTVTLHRQP